MHATTEKQTSVGLKELGSSLSLIHEEVFVFTSRVSTAEDINASFTFSKFLKHFRTFNTIPQH